MLGFLKRWRKPKPPAANVSELLFEIDYLRRQLELSAERYDKIRDTNMQLREALDLYRRV